jgi:putative ABC transport system substrate-binding protein
MPLLDVFRSALGAAGYHDGRDVVIESSWPAGDRLDLMTEAASSLLARKPAVLVAVGATAARAAKGVTRDVPIVFEVVVDPVATGIVASLGIPGGNVTGCTTFDPQFATKQLQLLKSVLPKLARLALLGDAEAAPSLFQSVEQAAQAVGLESLSLKVERSPNPDFEAAFERATKERAHAVLVLSTPVTTPHRKRIAELALKHRLPTLSPRDHADAGGLLNFGTSFVEATRHSATYVSKILKGARPAELPVERVSRHELLVNLTAARHLGIEVPASILSSASQVIQ